MYKVMQYRTEDGVKMVLVGPAGRKYIPVLIMTNTAGLALRKVPLSEQRYMTEVPGKPRALSTRLATFRRFGKTAGMTKAAKAFLTDAKRAA